MQNRDLPIARALAPALVAAVALGTVACTPTVRIEASDKPITINLNVKIDQEVRYRLDKDLEDAIAKNPDLF
ncbi:MAG TPA: YnbE family lipoprotein [Hyphomonadaceae bacterium]|nr:YnbE family lipoprotein [Hyphomonadaceae bacterium]